MRGNCDYCGKECEITQYRGLKLCEKHLHEAKTWVINEALSTWVEDSKYNPEPCYYCNVMTDGTQTIGDVHTCEEPECMSKGLRGVRVEES